MVVPDFEDVVDVRASFFSVRRRSSAAQCSFSAASFSARTCSSADAHFDAAASRSVYKTSSLRSCSAVTVAAAAVAASSAVSIAAACFS